MRSLMISLLAASSLTATADDHYYAGFELGVTASPDQELTRAADGLALEADKNLGPVGGVFVGKKLGKQRFELQYLVRRNYFDSVNVSNVGSTGLAAVGEYGAGGSQRTDSLMANVWHTLLGNENWALLGGIGLGMSNVKLDSVRTAGENVTYVSSSKWVPAVQAMAQLTAPVGKGMEFGVGYRYLHNLSGDFANKIGETEYQAKNHELFARLSWRFGGSEPKAVAPAPAPMPVVAKPAPAPEPAPAPKPKPAALPGPFLVFFDFDKSAITAEAADIIKAAAKAFREHKAIKIETSGHTDSAGANEYNVKLSKSRADAVKARLVSEGVAASDIAINYEGETTLRVNTEDGTREWQNRRVEITLVR